MDLTPPSPPPDPSDIDPSEIEIPEPDYDDDSDDDVTEPASGFYDNERDDQDETTAADERPENGKQRRVEDADDARQVSTSDDDHLDDNNVGVDNSLDFDGARAKLEEFSLEQRRLRGSVRAADPDVDIPPPDYSDSDDQQDDVTDEELIAAKKLVNPCLESKEYKALRRELKLNQKLGINVLDNKTELHKEMDKRKRRQQREEELQQRQNRRSSLAIRLKQQAVKLDMAQRDPANGDGTTAVVSPTSVDAGQPPTEFLRVHAKISQQPKSAS